MNQQLGQLSLLVKDYDEAIQYYTQTLGFDLLEDTPLSDTKRWVRVAPKGSSCQLLLAKAANEAQLSQVGCQAGGRVFLFLTQHARRLSTMCMSAVIVRFPHDAPTLPLTGVGAFSCPGVRLVRLLTLILQE